MSGLEGDDDVDMEIGSQFAYQSMLDKPREAQSTNMTSMDFKQHNGENFGKKGSQINIVNEIELRDLNLNDRNDTQ